MPAITKIHFRSLLVFALVVCICVALLINIRFKITDAPKLEGFGSSGDNLLVLTIATREHTTLKLFSWSVGVHGMELKVLGMGQKWYGLGQKIALLKQELEDHKHDLEKIILFADAYDVIFNAGSRQIIERFKRFNARVLFSAEYNCWPIESLCPKYPPVIGKPYLNSGLIIGYAPEFYQVVKHSFFPLNGNDQEYFTRIYLDQNLRRTLNLKLDSRSELVQTLEGGDNKIQLSFQRGGSIIRNQNFDTVPLIIHAPGKCKLLVSLLANVMSRSWNDGRGCPDCLDDTFRKLPTRKANGSYPFVLLSVVVDEGEYALAEFFVQLANLDYPKENTNLILHKIVRGHSDLFKSFAKSYGSSYRSFQMFHYDGTPDVSIHPVELAECMSEKCTFNFDLRSKSNRLGDAQLLRMLIEQNRTFFQHIVDGVENEGIHVFSFKFRSDHCPSSFDILGKNYQLTIGTF